MIKAVSWPCIRCRDKRGGRGVSSVLVRRRQGSIREAWTGEPPRRPRPAKFKVQPAGEATRLELGFGEGWVGLSGDF